MIARELTEFFDGFAPDGRPVLQRRGDPTFLSNVNACYSRACWAELRFPDVAYSEDQAFGSAMLEAGWVKVFHPAAAVRHAHDYGAVDFTRRYFDEYRGLRETTGHVEPLQPKQAARELVRDARWMRESGMPPASRARWLPRAAAHHAGRRVGSALGARAARLPDRVQRALSLEGRGAGDRGRSVKGGRGRSPYEEILQVYAAGSRSARGAGGGDGRAHAAPHRRGDPAVRQGQRRAHDDLHAGRPARASGPHLQHLDVRPTREAPASERGGAPSPCCRGVRPDASAGLQGVRRLARRRRGGGHGLGYRLPGGAPPPRSRPRLPHQ